METLSIVFFPERNCDLYNYLECIMLGSAVNLRSVFLKKCNCKSNVCAKIVLRQKKASFLGMFKKKKNTCIMKQKQNSTKCSQLKGPNKKKMVRNIDYIPDIKISLSMSQQ